MGAEKWSIVKQGEIKVANAGEKRRTSKGSRGMTIEIMRTYKRSWIRTKLPEEKDQKYGLQRERWGNEVNRIKTGREETPGRSWASHPPELSLISQSLQEADGSKQVSDVGQGQNVAQTWRRRWKNKKRQQQIELTQIHTGWKSGKQPPPPKKRCRFDAVDAF